MSISLVVPCYNEEENIFPFFEKCLEVFKEEKDIEYIFINDGSKDYTFGKIKELIKTYSKYNIIGLNFSRNFGKEAAMLAGMKKSKGDYVAIIDADLQQNPKYVKEMVRYLNENPDCDEVACYQEKRKESKLLIFFKKMFYSLINKLSEVNFEPNASDFRLLRRNVVNSLIEMEEYYRFSKGLFSFVGFNTYYMPYQVEERLHGKSSWSIIGLFKYAINGIISFSLIPLKFATVFGCFSFLLSIIYLLFIVVQKFTVGIDIIGYPTVVCLILFFGGLQMIFLGIIGEYLGRTYIESKKRPKYIIKNEINFNNLRGGGTNEKN